MSTASVADRIKRPLRDLFDVPDLDGTDDHIANGTFEAIPGEPLPLAPFTAQRIDYSLHRLSHYTATSPHHFQNFVLFTNYQFYIDEFCVHARELMAKGGDGYDCLRRARQRRHAGRRRRAAGRLDAAAHAADAGLSPDQAGPWRHHHGQYRRRPVQRQDDHRPHRGAAGRMPG